MRTLRREAPAVTPVTLPRVNLLPPEILEAARFRRVQAGLGLGVVAAFALVGALYVSATGAVSDADRQLQAATSEQRALQGQIATYHDVTAKYAAAATAQQMLVQAMSSEVRYSRFLNDLSLSMPENVWLTNATWAQDASSSTGLGTVTITGVARSHDDVAGWLEQLAAQRGYAAPYLQSSTEVLLDTQKVVNWSTTVVLTADALSARYTKVGG